MTDYRMIGRVGIWISVVVLLFVAHAATAQQPDPINEPIEAPLEGAKPAAAPPAKQAPAPDSSVNDSIMEMVLNSGATGLSFLVVLILFSLAAVTVSLERAVNTRRDRVLPGDFLTELRTLLERNDTKPDEFVELCEKKPSPIANILQAGLLRRGRPVPEVEKSMEDAAAREMAEIRGGIKPLSIVGNIAPLVGLLGTVLGMIIAFRTASQEGLGRGELMAQGI